MVEEELTFSVIGAFFEVYNTLGHGFLEHLYVVALERELLAKDHHVAREVSVPVFYKGYELGRQRLDMIVDEKLVVETKSSYVLPQGHWAGGRSTAPFWSRGQLLSPGLSSEARGTGIDEKGANGQNRFKR